MYVLSWRSHDTYSDVRNKFHLSGFGEEWRFFVVSYVTFAVKHSIFTSVSPYKEKNIRIIYSLAKCPAALETDIRRSRSEASTGPTVSLEMLPHLWLKLHIGCETNWMLHFGGWCFYGNRVCQMMQLVFWDLPACNLWSKMMFRVKPVELCTEFSSLLIYKLLRFSGFCGLKLQCLHPLVLQLRQFLLTITHSHFLTDEPDYVNENGDWGWPRHQKPTLCTVCSV